MKKLVQLFKIQPPSKKFELTLNIVCVLVALIIGIVQIFTSKVDVALCLGLILTILGLYLFTSILVSSVTLTEISTDLKQAISDSKSETMVDFSTRKKIESNIDLNERFKDADEIYIMASASYGFFIGMDNSVLIGEIQKGTNFKIVGIDPNSPAAAEYNKHKYPLRKGQSDNVMSSGLEAVRATIANRDIDLHNLEYRITDLNLPFALLIVKKKGKIKSLKVDFYGFNDLDADRRSIDLGPDNQDLIEYFHEQWNYVWKNTEDEACYCIKDGEWCYLNQLKSRSRE